MRKLIGSMMPLALAGALAIGCPGWAQAQQTGTAGGGGGTSGGFGGGGGGSSMGGSSGSSRGSASGGTSGGSASSTSNQTYGASSFLGSYYNNPYAYGVSASSTTGSSSASSASIGASFGASGTSGSASIGGSSGGSSSSSGGTIVGPSAASAKFGQAVYGNLTKTTTSGTATIRSPSSTTTQQQPSSSVRPAYVAYPAFIPDRVPVGVAEINFRDAVLQSKDLSNPNNRIQLVRDGDRLILRGEVQDERERYLAEVMAGMTPGLRGIRNELAVRESAGTQTSAR